MTSRTHQRIRYTLTSPIEITSRLMPGVRLGGGTISIDYGGVSADHRRVYQVWIDLPDGAEYEITDLRSGVGGGSLQRGLESLLAFLGAAAESRQYRERTGRGGENEDLFPPAVVEWAAENSDEIGLLQLEIEETPGLIRED